MLFDLFVAQCRLEMTRARAIRACAMVTVCSVFCAIERVSCVFIHHKSLRVLILARDVLMLGGFHMCQRVTPCGIACRCITERKRNPC